MVQSWMITLHAVLKFIGFKLHYSQDSDNIFKIPTVLKLFVGFLNFQQVNVEC